MTLRTGTISYENMTKYKGQPDNETALSKLGKELHLLGSGRGRQGERQGDRVVKNEQTAKAVLQQLQNKYAPPQRMKSSFDGIQRLSSSRVSKAKTDVAGESASAESSSRRRSKSRQRILIPPRCSVRTSLSEFWPLAMNQRLNIRYRRATAWAVSPQVHQISREVIYQNNPSIEDDLIKAGDVIDLTVKKPAVNVVTTESQTEIITTEPQVIVQKKATMKAGETRSSRRGNRERSGSLTPSLRKTATS